MIAGERNDWKKEERERKNENRNNIIIREIEWERNYTV